MLCRNSVQPRYWQKSSSTYH